MLRPLREVSERERRGHKMESWILQWSDDKEPPFSAKDNNQTTLAIVTGSVKCVPTLPYNSFQLLEELCRL